MNLTILLKQLSWTIHLCILTILKVSLALNIFYEKTVGALKLKGYDDTAFFIEKILKMWNIINVKGPDEGRRLNNSDKYPIENCDDDRLKYLLKMGTSLKLMDSSKRGEWEV